MKELSWSDQCMQRRYQGVLGMFMGRTIFNLRNKNPFYIRMKTLEEALEQIDVLVEYCDRKNSIDKSKQNQFQFEKDRHTETKQISDSLKEKYDKLHENFAQLQDKYLNQADFLEKLVKKT